MITVETTYTGGMRTRARHVKSGEEIITDAPTDNHGKGEAFSPTDLMTASLGSCMLTIMGIAAENHGFNIDGATMSTTKIMANDPRRVSEIKIILNFPDIDYTDAQVRLLEHISKTCPVALSLHPDLKQHITLNFHRRNER